MNEGASPFGDLGIIIEAGGNKPLMLDRADKIWVVERGHADVFTLGEEGGQGETSRRHLFTAAEGDILIGSLPPTTGRSRRMLASGPFGTAIREVDSEAFFALGEMPDKADDIQRLLRRWLRNASLGLRGKEAMPRNSRDLSESGRLPIHPGGNVHPTFKTMWIRLEPGKAAFLGRDDFPMIPVNRTFPLVRGTWLKAVDEAVISYAEEWPPISWGRLSTILNSFCCFLLECCAANAARAEELERARMEGRAASRRSMFTRGLEKLSGITEPRRFRLDLEADKRRPLLSACRIVGRSQGMELPSAWNGMSGPMASESLEDIGRAAGFRSRQVVLKEGWWKRDNGPLLVYREKDHCPLAALPLSPRKYQIVDPVEGNATLLTRAVAESLDVCGHVLYRPLPNRRLGGWDVIRLGIRGCSGDLATAFFAGLGGALLSLLAPWMTGLIFDYVIPGARLDQLALIGGLLALGAFAGLLFDGARGIAILRTEGSIESSAQAALWDRLLSLPLPFFSNYTAGDLAERSMGISTIRHVVSNTAITAVVAGLFSLANLWLLFGVSASLAWLALALCGLGTCFFLGVSLALVRSERRVVDLKGKNQGIVFQLVTGIAKLRVSSAEDSAFSIWAESYAKMKRQAFWSAKLESLIPIFASVFPTAALMAIFAALAGGSQIGLSAGGFLVFSSAFIALSNAMIQTGIVMVSSIQILPVYERAKPILETLPEVDEAKEKPSPLSGRIEINHLSYRYHPEGPSVLKDVSMNVAPGEFVALVGGSGSGKSTLLRLLLGFTRPEAGAIYYDGQDLGSLDALAVRRQIGVVLQNGQLPGGSIAKAILGSSKLTLDDAWEAACMVGLDRDIKDMPMGMYTVIPAGGGTLSGGQRQRLLIARAIVRKPRILFFDEATSALDNKTQAIVSESLAALQVSSLVIAHRLSTVINSDRIYVLDEGRVVEAGTYQELMDRCGLFYVLAKRQSA
ncbi:MAG TPA: NHLP bacteriocin export ABC transporter permease/ATPase subunit [Rectinemataceae bacterium]|nr:NHLP bacteriocin export ABC transporter permease/ATPase subunit [Rectinemataceae bacterium]